MVISFFGVISESRLKVLTAGSREVTARDDPSVCFFTFVL